MPVPLPAQGVCPFGTVPVVGSDGSIQCWDPNEVGFPGIPGTGQKPEPNPSSPAGGAQPPSLPQRGPTGPFASGVTQRQPGAPSVPFNPPGRIGLWPGPIFNPPAQSFAPVPTTSTSTSTTEIGGAVLGEGPIFVNVNNATNIADNSAANAVGAVANAVQSAIGAAVSQADQVATATQSDIISALQGTTGAISGGVNAAFTSLVAAIQAIQSATGAGLDQIGNTIGADLVNTLNPVTGALEALVIQITRQLGGLAGGIAQAVAQVIPLIIAAVENPIGALKGVLGQIEADIGNNLASLVQIPGAIASAQTSLDATLGRIFTSYESFTERTTGWGEGETAHGDLSNIWKALAGVINLTVGSVNPKPSDHITSICGQDELTKVLNKPWFDPTGNTGLYADIIKALLKGLISALFYVASIIPAIRKTNEELQQRMDAACPIDPLPIAPLVDAVMRGILPLPEAIAEAGKSDISEQRFQIYRDLALHQMNPDQLVEALYRSIVSEPDFEAALAAQGWSQSQVNLLKALRINLLTTSEGLELLRRGLIDSPTLDKLLSSLAYDDAQRKALSSLAFRPSNINEATAGGAAGDAFTSLPIAVSPQVFNPPENVERAGAAEGLDHEATVNHWLSHWNTGSFNVWTNLFFRGQVTLQTLQAMATREFIPPELVPGFIEAQRPLVQFRTISTALRANIIKDEDARLLLRQHGYSEKSIDLLIAYAHRPGAASAVKNAPRLHEVSLSIAKEEYIDGSITADQYLAILTQHGFTTDGANTELQVVNAREAMLRRKEASQLVIDEFGAGLIDEQAALAQLALLGLTVDELARAAHKIRAFRAKNAKHPTESELHNFLKLNLITPQQYIAELRSIGYSQNWAETFLAWREAPAAGATGSAKTVPPQPTGP